MAEIKNFPNNVDEYICAQNVMKWLHGRTSGVFGADGNLSVTANGNMTVRVSDGVGWLANDKADGTVFWNDTKEQTGSELQLTIPLPDAILPRIDRIVVSWDTVDYAEKPRIEVLKGTPNNAPTAPELTNNTLKRQISLARIYVAAAVSSISSDNITDERLDTSVCGLVTDWVSIDTSMMHSQFEELLKAIQKELADLEAGTAVELKKLLFTNVAVPVSYFVADTTYQDYGFRAAVSLEGVISSMIPEAIFGVEDATSGNFAPVVDTYDGGVYIYSESKPEAEVTVPTIICWRGA